MNLFKKISISITLVLSIFGLIGCEESDQKYIDKIEEIKITFQTNGGNVINTILINQTLIDSIDPEEISEVTLEDLDYLLPKKDGFLFDGWYLDEELENKLTIDNPIIEEYLDVFETEDSVTIDITLYAKWVIDDSIKTYTVNYYLDGGVNHQDNILSYTTDDTNFLLKEPIKEGYIFLGWYTDSSFKTPISSIDVSLEQDYQLYAKWEEVDNTVYTITYHLDGGVNDPENVVSYMKDDSDITLLSPTKDGFTFMGWYTDPDFVNSITHIDTSSKLNYTLYAKWGDLSMFIFTLVGNEYKIQGNNIDFTGTLVIPDTFNGKPVTMIADGGFLMYEGITSIVFGKNIHTIGSSAFSSCTGLTSLVIPDHVLRIESGAFEHCDNLESVIIGDGVTYIGGFAFNSDDNLTTVTLGLSVNYIGRQAFSHLGNLTSINLPNGLETIEEYAFFNCPNLATITIPESVTFIGQYTFYGCNPLTIMLSTTYVPTEWNSNWNLSECEVVLKGETPSETYYLTYHLDGGVNGDHNPSSYKGDVEIILSNPTKDGFLFIGWFTDSSFTTEITSIPVGYNQNINLYAKWEENSAPSYLDYQEYDTYVAITGLNNDSITEIVIPEMYRGKPVTVIAENAFYYKQNITSVVLPDTITTIEKGAFLATRSLQSIHFPSSLTTLEDYAFSDTGLTELVIPNTILYFGEELFYNCDNLITVTLPDNLVVIPRMMFGECDLLESINIPESVTTIEDEAFTGCMSLTAIDLLDVTMIGYAAFSNCQSLEEIILSDDLTIIEDYAFAYTMNVTKIELPENLEIIGVAAFSGCSKVGVIEFPETLKYIGESAFWACRLTEISLPSSLISIGEHAFRYNNFTTLYLPDSLQEIELLAFRDCDKLQYVYLPTSIPYVEERIFRDTGYGVTLYLDSDDIPDTWSVEWKDYFYGQTIFNASITSTTITYVLDGGTNNPSNLSTVKANNSMVLYNPTKAGYHFLGWYLEDTFETKVSSVAQHSSESLTLYAKWEENTSLTHSITYHIDGGYLKQASLDFYNEGDNTPLLSPTKAGYQFIGWFTDNTFTNKVTNTESFTGDVSLYALFEEDYLYYEEFDNYVVVTGLKQPLYDVVIPSSYNGKPVTTIGAHAFEYETSVISITLPNTITTIEDNAITANNLRFINLEEGITSIGDYAFYGANDLVSITIPSTVTHLGDNVFYSCNSLEEVIFLNNLTEITEGMFANCESLESIDIPVGVTSIGVDAFRGCDLLSSVTIPSTVTSIGAYAFSYTDSLKEITIPSSVVEIGNSAFRESGLTSLVIPDTVTTVGSDIWYYSRFLESIYIGKEFNAVLSSNDFVGLTALEEINVHSENTIYDSIDGVLYGHLEQYTLIKYPIKKSGSSYTIQDGTIIIERQAFTETTLSEIIIPNSVTSIGYSAFSSNQTMKSIYIPNSVVTMESSVFYNNSHLKIYVQHDQLPESWDNYWTDQSNEVYYSVELSDISVYADVVHYIIVDDHIEIISVTPVLGGTINIDIPNEINSLPVTTIHSYAFVNLNVNIIIPSTVTTIHKYAFYSTYGTVYTDYSSKPLLWDDSFYSYGITVTYDAIWFKMDSQGGNYSFPIIGSSDDLKPIGRGWIPVKEGYVFDGWYTDILCTPGNEFTFTQLPGSEDLMPSSITVIYAKWVSEE